MIQIYLPRCSRFRWNFDTKCTFDGIATPLVATRILYNICCFRNYNTYSLDLGISDIKLWNYPIEWIALEDTNTDANIGTKSDMRSDENTEQNEDEY